jgi:hypothetical protein
VVVPIHNVATVSMPDDADPSNDSGSDTVRSLSRPAPAPGLSFGGSTIALLGATARGGDAAASTAVAAADLRRRSRLRGAA